LNTIFYAMRIPQTNGTQFTPIPLSSTILRQQDENIADELQSTLQKFAVSGRENLRPYYHVFSREKDKAMPKVRVT